MKWKPFTAMVLVLAGSVVSPVLAADDAAVDAVATDEATLDGLRAEYDKNYADWVARIRTAPDREAQEAIMKDRPMPAETAEKMIPLIKKQADDPALMKHLAWVIQSMRNDTPDAVADVLEKHKESADVAAVILVASTSMEGRTGEILDWIRQNNKQGKVKAASAFIRAQKRDLPEDEKLALMKVAAADAGDLELRGRKVADMAAAGVYEIENLGIGKVAGEIEGTDQDGVAFKLSDYRGKVVVLDFWGDW